MRQRRVMTAVVNNYNNIAIITRSVYWRWSLHGLSLKHQHQIQHQKTTHVHNVSQAAIPLLLIISIAIEYFVYCNRIYSKS